MSHEHAVSTKNLCTLPWVQLSSSPTGGLNYCCESPFVYSEDGSNRNLPEFWNSEYMRNVRKALLKGDMESYCKNCKLKEQKGLQSLRQASRGLVGSAEFDKMLEYTRANDGEADSRPHQLDIRFSSKCNMRCRMCSPYNSSEIYREFNLNRPQYKVAEVSSVWEGADMFYKNSSDWDIPELVEFCKTPRNVNISGGEPLLQKEFYQLIDILCERDLAKNITLQITTNASIYPKDFGMKLQQFQSVRLLLSVDAEGETYDYIRYPYKWGHISKQILKFNLLKTKKIKVIITPTTQALNLLNLPRLLAWSLDHGVNFELFTSVVDPDYMSTDILPQALIKKATRGLKRLAGKYKLTEEEGRHLRTLISGMETTQPCPAKDVEKKRIRFAKHMKLQDELRGQSFKVSIPELSEVFGESSWRTQVLVARKWVRHQFHA